MSYSKPKLLNDYESGLGHFKTNFSTDGLDNNTSRVLDRQIDFERIPFETQFNTVNQNETFLHQVDTFMVPVTDHYITFSGTWSDISSASYIFGNGKSTSTINDTVIFEFSGVSIYVCMLTDTNYGNCHVELSKDGGSTWEQRKNFTADADANTGNTGIIWELYSGLPYGNYKIRITVDYTSTYAIRISHFIYATYVCQSSQLNTFYQSSSIKSITDVPPTTTLLTGGITSKNYRPPGNSVGWGYSVQQRLDTSGDTAEMKFYGSKIWAHVGYFGTAFTFDVLIDGATTDVKSSTVSSGGGNDTTVSYWVQLDDGTLSEGWHTVKLTKNSNTTYFYGWSWYSSNGTSTVCKSAICGKNSYIVGVDSSDFTFNGTWNSILDNGQSILRRSRGSSNSGANVTITTPNNCKAIYLVMALGSSSGDMKCELASSNARYITNDTDNVTVYNNIWLIYDSVLDGDISNKEFKLSFNTTWVQLSGVIFECGDPIENDAIFCMKKLTTFEQAAQGDGYKESVSNTHRLDVYGRKTDSIPGRLPTIKTHWFYRTTSNTYTNIGFPAFINEVTVQQINGDQSSNGYGNGTTYLSEMNAVTKLGAQKRPNIIYCVSGNNNNYTKVLITPNRVI